MEWEFQHNHRTLSRGNIHSSQGAHLDLHNLVHCNARSRYSTTVLAQPLTCSTYTQEEEELWAESVVHVLENLLVVKGSIGYCLHGISAYLRLESVVILSISRTQHVDLRWWLVFRCKRGKSTMIKESIEYQLCC